MNREFDFCDDVTTPYDSVEIVIETQFTTDSLVAAFLPGKIQSGSFAPNGEVLGDDLGDSTITKIRFDDPDRTRLIICPSPDGAQNEDDRIKQLCHEIGLLPKDARREWDEADVREFYIGYDVDGIEYSYNTRLNQDTIRAVSALHSSIGIAMYAGRNGHTRFQSETRL